VRIPEGLKSYLWKYRILFGAMILMGLVVLLDATVFRPRTARKDRLLSFSMSELRSFTVMNAEGRYVFVRNGEGWDLPGVPGLRLGKREIDSFLDECRDLRFRRKLSPSAGENLHAFGLDVTNVLIRIETTDGVVDLVRGADIPGGGGYYAGSGGRVYAMDGPSAAVFGKDLFAFRDKRIIDAQAPYVRKIRLNFRGASVRLEKQDHGWLRTGGNPGPVPDETVSSFLFELESFEATEFVSGRDLNWTYFGFPASDAVELGLADGSTFRLGLGRRDKQGVAVGQGLEPKELAWTDPYLLTAVSNYVHLFTVPESPDVRSVQGENDETR
jgi:hypothetical protein